MRGTGYAISEILIFLAIAAIIGFLLGWLVFRRSGAAAVPAKKLDTKELKRAETRVKALEALMAKAERRAESAVAAASKAATLKPAAGAAAAVAGAGKAPDSQKAKPDAAKPDAAKKAPEPAKADSGKGSRGKVREPAKADTAKEQPKKAPEPAKAAVPDKKAAPEKKPADAEPATSTGDEELDEYLSDADARIQKLEKTLERLRGKLDDIEE